jgi:haloalkane dehalogenase
MPPLNTQDLSLPKRAAALSVITALTLGACASQSSESETARSDTSSAPTVSDSPNTSTPDTSTPNTATPNSEPLATAAPSTVDAAVPAGPELLDVQVASGVVPIAIMENGPDPALPVGAIERRIEHEGHDIYTIEIPGEGPPIVLAHGFPDSLHLYDELFPFLAGRRVIAFDFIGWGRSDKPLPGSEYDYTTRGQAGEMAAVIDGYGLEDVTLVVHDQSGPVGLEYLLADESKVGEFIFMNGFFGASPNLSPPKGIEVHNTPALQPVELAIEADPAAIEALHRFQMDEFIIKSPNEQAVIDTLWSQFPEARPAFVAINDILSAEVAERTSRVERLAELTVPIDIVHGALDPYLTAELAVEFDELLPNSTLTLVEDAGHYVQIDSPEIVADAILNRNT